jgi:acylphosphatase
MSSEAQADRDLSVRHVVVRGRVQGVGFRAWTEMIALERGLQGWVRNRRDGTVEAVFAGETSAVEAMLAACRRGPPGARVDVLEEQHAGVSALDQRHAGERFSVLPTS